jgi:phage anti-repressor protein
MSIDIVKLIEKNPLVKLTGNYQSSMIDKIKEKFNTYEQQLFVSSFYCYLNYDDKIDFVIDLDNVWQWLGFSQKVNAKCVLEKNFIKNSDYKIFAPEVAGAKKDGSGGHNKEIIMLTINAFKRFCLKAGTKKADEIHEYYIKMEKVLQDVLFEECNALTEQVKQIKQENTTKELEFKTKLNNQKELEKEKILLRQFSISIPIVYIIKVKTFENGQYIVKIGESRRGITGRYNEHKGKYSECLLLDVFAVNRSKDFESYIHNHKLIRSNRVRDLEGHENELELFLIGKELSYQMILDAINSQIDNFQESSAQKLDLEIELEKLKLQTQQNNTSVLEKQVALLLAKIDNLEKLVLEIPEKLKTLQPKTVTGFQEPLVTLGPRLQKINPETLELVKVYECASDAMNENRNIKRPSLSKAVLENAVYCGFRWAFVDRALDASRLENVAPSKAAKQYKQGYIAKMTADGSEILNVYIDRKTAAMMNGYDSWSALDTPVKKGTVTKGHIYKLFEECENKESFIQKHGKEPLLYKNGFGIFNSNGKMVHEYACRYDCIRSQKISDKTIAKAIEKNVPYKDMYFRDLGEKVSFS